MTSSLVGFGVPADQASSVARDLSQQGHGPSQSGVEAIPPQLRDHVLSAVRLDYAEATRVVFYGMAIALAVAFVIALFHPGGKVTHENPSGL